MLHGISGFALGRCACAILLIVAIGGESAVSADDMLDAVVGNIRTNEELYSNIEMIFEQSYVLHKEVMHPAHFEGDGGANLVLSSHVKGRIVLQGEMRYVDWGEEKTTVDGTVADVSTIHGFDGETSRVVHPSVANIRKGRTADGRFLDFHTLLLVNRRVDLPLSGHFTADAAGRRGSKSATSYVGTETQDGLECAKVRIDYWGRDPDAPPIRYDLIWLAVDRNYLPVRVESYAKRHSEQFPQNVNRVAELREISSGIWFPFRATMEIYDEAWLWEAKAVLSAEREYRFTEVSLDPQYDISLFRDISIPKGTRVIEVGADGAVTDKYREQIAGPFQRASRWFLWAFLLAVAVALASKLIRRKLRMRRLACRG